MTFKWNFDAFKAQEYYVQAVKEKNIANNIPGMNMKQVNSNKLKIEIDEIAIDSIKISNIDRIQQADISGVFKVIYKEGLPEYLRINKALLMQRLVYVLNGTIICTWIKYSAHVKIRDFP